MKMLIIKNQINIKSNQSSFDGRLVKFECSVLNSVDKFSSPANLKIYT